MTLTIRSRFDSMTEIITVPIENISHITMRQDGDTIKYFVALKQFCSYQVDFDDYTKVRNALEVPKESLR